MNCMCDHMIGGTLYRWVGEVGVYFGDYIESKSKQLTFGLGPYVKPGDMLLYIGPDKSHVDLYTFLYKEKLVMLGKHTLNDFIRYKHLLPIAGHETYVIQ